MKPLTIEQLKALEVGDWVWVTHTDGDSGTYMQIGNKKYNRIVLCGSFIEIEYAYEYYDKMWLAWKNKEQAEAKGEIVDLPCKVGDTVWLLNDPYFVADICEVVIEEIKISRSGTTIFCLYDDEYCEFIADAVFKTKSEAERRLAELKDKEEK